MRLGKNTLREACVELATFGESDYNQKDSEGFINLFGLPIKVRALMEKGML